MGFPTWSLSGGARHSRPASGRRPDREGRADPLCPPLEHEPAGGSHWPLLQSWERDHLRITALELFVNEDLNTMLKIYDERAQVITDAVMKFGVTALPREFNPQALRQRHAAIIVGRSIRPNSKSPARKFACNSSPTPGRSESAAWALARAEWRGRGSGNALAGGDHSRTSFPARSKHLWLCCSSARSKKAKTK